MSTEGTILPISPDHFWPISGIAMVFVASLIIYAVISGISPGRPKSVLENLLRPNGYPMIIGSLTVAALFLAALVAACFALWNSLGPAQNTNSNGPNLGAGALIAALLGAPFLIWGTVLKHQTVRYQKEGHMTDRINKAVEQLGAEKTEKVYTIENGNQKIQAERTVPNIEVRIGAILSLERIAQDSTTHDKGRDHVRVMEILCTYVRENSNARELVKSHPEVPPPNIGPTDAQVHAYRKKLDKRYGLKGQTSEIWEWALALKPPRADVAQALLVIGRRSMGQKKAEAAWPSLKMDDANWPFVKPPKNSHSQEYADWLKAILDYKGFRLDLQGANLQGAVLNGYDHDEQGLDFSGALLKGARLDGANLTFARVVAADLKEISLLGARLSNASFELSDLSGSNLCCCETEELAIRLCALRGADLRGSGLSPPQLASAFGDKTVELPEPLDPILRETLPEYLRSHWKDYGSEHNDTELFREAWMSWRRNPNHKRPPQPPAPEEDKA